MWRERDYDSGKPIPDGVIVAAVFAAVLVSLNGVEIAVSLRIAGVESSCSILRGERDRQSSTKGLEYLLQRQKGADEGGGVQ